MRVILDGKIINLESFTKDQLAVLEYILSELVKTKDELNYIKNKMALYEIALMLK